MSEKRILLCVFLILFLWGVTVISLWGIPLNEGTSFFFDHAKGWHWYEVFPSKDKTKKQTLGPKIKRTPNPLTPTQMIKIYRIELYRRRDVALVNPTLENVKAYQEMQHHWMNKSERFAGTWKEVVFRNPKLDETITHPITQVTRHVYFDEKNKQEEETLKTFSKTMGLFFFFKEDCPFCHKFATLVKRFCETYGFSVLPISLDGKGIPEFPNPVPDNGISNKLGVSVVPSLYMVSPKTDQVFPIAHGMISLDEIKDRLLFLVSRQEKRS